MPGSLVERRRQRHDARVLDAVREAAVAEHALQRRRDRPARGAAAPARARRARAGRRRRGRRPRPRTRATRAATRASVAHRLLDVVGADRGERAHRLELLELVGELLRRRDTDSTASAAERRRRLQASSVAALELVVLAAEDDHDVVRDRHERGGARVVRPEDELLAAVGEPRRAGASQARRRERSPRPPTTSISPAQPAPRPLPPKCTNRLPVTRRSTKRSLAPTDAAAASARGRWSTCAYILEERPDGPGSRAEVRPAASSVTIRPRGVRCRKPSCSRYGS